MEFYGDSSHGAGMDQMDPLGTTANASAQQSGTGTTGEPVIGKLSGGKKAKKDKAPMSTGKKVGLALGGMFFLAAILASLGDQQQPAPKISPQANHNAGDAAAAAAAVAAASANGMMDAHANAESTTVMGGDAAPAQGAPGAETQNQVPTQNAAPGSVTSTPAAPAPASLAAQGVSPQTAAQPAVQPAAAAARPATTPAAPAVAKAAAQEPAAAMMSQDNAKLVERVSELERKLAKMEQAKSARQATAARSEERAAPRSRAARPAANVAVNSNKSTVKPSYVAPTQGTSIAAATPAAGAEVRVLGTTIRQGAITALISVGGANHRVGEGQMLPGVGVVSKIGADAAGNAYADVNGVKYQ